MTIIISGNLKGLYKVSLRGHGPARVYLLETTEIDLNDNKVSESQPQKVNGSIVSLPRPELARNAGLSR